VEKIGYMVSEAWKEGTCIDQYTCQKPDGVTWFSKDSEVSDWSEPGGVWNNSIIMNGKVADSTLTVDITEAVKSWMNENTINNGLILRQVDQWTYLFLSAKESHQAPFVKITYIPASDESGDQSDANDNDTEQSDNDDQIHTLKLKQGHNDYAGFTDTTISSRHSTSKPENNGNYGGNEMLGLYNDERRVLMAFDVSDIPENAQIIDATLSVNIVKGNSHEVKAFIMNESWEEGSCIDQYVCRHPDGVTWFSRSPELGAWSTPGGVINHDIQLNTTIIENTIEIDVTEAVQLWVNSQMDNNGIILKEVTQWTSMLLSASESSKAPEVIIRYTMK